VKITEKQRVGAHFLARNTLGVEGRAGVLGWGLRIMTSINYSHKLAKTKQQGG
jgi:hypothetical protein